MGRWFSLSGSTAGYRGIIWMVIFLTYTFIMLMP